MGGSDGDLPKRQVQAGFQLRHAAVEFNEIGDILDYCSGVVCRTPEELFDVLLDDFQGYEEIRLTKGRRDTTEDELEAIRVLCQRYLDRREEEMK